MQRYFPTLSLGLFCAVAVLLPPIVAYLNRATVILLALAVVAAAMRRPGWRAVTGWVSPFAPMAVFIVWGMASAVWADTPDLALPQAAQLAGLVIGGGIVLGTVRSFDPIEAKWLGRAVLAGLVLGLGMIASDWADGCRIMLPVQALRGKLSINGCYLPYLKTAPTVLAVMMPAVWGWAGQNWPKRFAALGLTLALVLVADITDSHATVLAVALAGATVLAVWGCGQARTAKLLALVLAGLVVAAPMITSTFPNPKDLALAAPWLPNSARHRVAIWQFTERLIAERPALGWGLNGARAVPGGNDPVDIWMKDRAGQIYAQPQPQLPLHPHNLALQIWLETGLVGAVLAGWALLRLVSEMKSPWALAQAGAAFAVALVSFGAWQAWWLACLWLFAAFASALDARARTPLA